MVPSGAGLGQESHRVNCLLVRHRAGSTGGRFRKVFDYLLLPPNRAKITASAWTQESHGPLNRLLSAPCGNAVRCRAGRFWTTMAYLALSPPKTFPHGSVYYSTPWQRLVSW